MLGEQYGRALIDDARSLSHAQYDLAAQVADDRPKSLIRLVWIPPEVKKNPTGVPPKQRKFLDSVQNESGDRPPEILTNNFEAFKETVFAAVDRLEEADPHPDDDEDAMPPGGNGALVFVTGYKSDFADPDASAMIQCLSRQHDVFKSPVDNQQATPDLRETAYIKYCDGLMILYGKHAPKDWIEGKVFEARELTMGRRKKRLTVAVYDGPPPDKEEFPFIARTVVLLDCRNGFQPKELERFLDRIKTAGKGE